MIPKTKWPLILSSCLCGVLLLAGCSSETKHKWMTVFFDGVPGSTGKPDSAQPKTPQGAGTNATPARLNLPEEPLMFVHQPYAERKCVACHASDYSQRLKDDVSNICISCHKAFLVRAEFQHAPMEDGQCTICHASHQSKEKFLLIKNSRELCFDCHDPEEVLKIKPCGESQAVNCTVCHDPHQENQRFLIRTHTDKPSPARDTTPDK
jgi:predicted CXXCH cytochrome family protein